MNVYILADMEGITGICLEDHTSAGTPEYEQARKWMTQDVNAAVEGALAGGAKRVVVLDGHGANHFYNLVYEDLHPGAEYIVGRPRPWYVTQLDESFDCMFLVGLHAMSGTPNAVLEHTWSTQSWYRCRLNGIETGEIGLMAAYAGHFGIPVAFVTGDKATCREAQTFLGDDITTVCVKEGLGRYTAVMRPFGPARDDIRKGASEALARLADRKPYLVDIPVNLEIDYIRVSHVDGIRLYSGMERVAPRTIRYSGPDVASTLYLMQ